MTQNEIVKFGLYAERAHRLALDIALYSSALGRDGMSFAVIADEVRGIGIKLHKAFDQFGNGKFDINDDLHQLEYLSINLSFEALRNSLERGESYRYKPFAVLMDEIQNLIQDIKEFMHFDRPARPSIFQANPKSMVLGEKFYFTTFTVGGEDFTENIAYVNEIALAVPENQKDGKFQLRGMEIPIVNIGKMNLKVKNEVHPMLIVNTDYAKQPTKCIQSTHPMIGQNSDLFAIPIDSIPVIFLSYAGQNNLPTSTIQSQFVRECWNCEEGHQMIFLNYENLQ